MKKKLWMLWCGVILCCMMLAVNVSATVWDGSVASGFAGGTGTEDDPYQIATAEQLAYLAETVNSGTTYEGQHIKLTADIVLNDTSEENWTLTAKKWTPIGTYTNKNANAPFCGTFDGGNHTISGLYIYALNGTTWMGYQGLFGYAYNAEFKDVTITNADITGADNVGTLVGYTYYSTVNADITCTISDCNVKNAKILGEEYVGGVVGQMYAYIGGISRTIILDIVVCSNENGSVQGNTYVGGLVGEADYNDYYGSAHVFVNFTECLNNSIIVSGRYAGGIIAVNYDNTVTFTKCTNSGTVSSSSNSFSPVGGIAGACNSKATFTKCTNSGTISSFSTTSSSVGGIAGHSNMNAIFTECMNSGIVTSDSRYYTYAGGIAGQCYDYLTVTKCINSGTVSSSSSSSSYVSAGGIVGDCYDFTATFTECTNSGTVTSSSYAGGITGQCGSTGTFVRCMNSGTVTSSSYAGGITGYCDSVAMFIECMNSATVTSCSYIGGVVGYTGASSNIESCCNTGSMIATNDNINVGGIVGEAKKSAVCNCYNTGTFCGITNVGGIVGYLLGGESKAEAFVYNCYNLGKVNGMKYNDTTPSSYIGSVIGQTSGQVHIAACYYLEDCASDDFGNIQNGIGSDDCTTPTTDIASMTISCTDTQMQQQSTYAGFDFNEIWTMGDADYPYPVFRTPEEGVPTLFGDVNNSGETDTEDNRILAQYFAGYDVGEEFINQDAADVNGDGILTRVDAMILSRHLAGWSGYETLPLKN